MIALNSNETLLVNMGNGLHRELSHQDVVDMLTAKKPRTRRQSKYGAISRAIYLLAYALEHGNYTTGHKAPMTALNAAEAKLRDRIDQLATKDRDTLLAKLNAVTKKGIDTCD